MFGFTSVQTVKDPKGKWVLQLENTANAFITFAHMQAT